MRTYYVNYYEKGWHKIELKAESIDNLRKRMIKEGIGDIARVKILVGGNMVEVGAMNVSLKYGYYLWTYRGPDGMIRTRKVSPKTGKLLDINKYWRYV